MRPRSDADGFTAISCTLAILRLGAREGPRLRAAGRTRVSALRGVELRRAASNLIFHSAMAKTCRLCGHSRAAHTDGVKCALCACVSRTRELVQESLPFKGQTRMSVPSTGRKR